MEKAPSGKLEPTLGLFSATAIGLGAIIGGGIFVVTGIVAGLAGPALVVSIALASLVSAFTALSFAQLTAWLPVEGSVYEFAYKLISPFAGFLGGWMWIVSNTFAGAAVSLGFSHYLVALFPGLELKVVAIAICVAFTVLNYLGIRHSAMLNNVLVLTKVLILSLFVAVGLFHLNPANFSPFVRSDIGVFYGTYFIFFAFTGFARVAVASEEVKNASKVVPQAIILALTLSTIIYVSVGIVAIGLAGSEALGQSSSPLSLAIGVLGNPLLTYVVSLGGMIATASVLLTSILGVSRMLYAMARRSDLPLALSRVHPKYNSPSTSILLVGFATTIIALFADLTGVVSVSTFSSLFYYALANASALKLKSNGSLRQKIIPILGLASCAALSVLVQPISFAIGLVCLLVGVIYYAGKKKLASPKA